jgi:hypothetical protein
MLTVTGTSRPGAFAVLIMRLIASSWIVRQLAEQARGFGPHFDLIQKICRQLQKSHRCANCCAAAWLVEKYQKFSDTPP